MIPLPRWMREAFKHSICPYCDSACKKTGVFGIGIRENANNTEQNRFTFFFEYHCHKCEKNSIFPGSETSFDEFIGDCIDIAEMPFEEQSKEKKKVKAEGMTDKEVADAKKLLNECSTFDEFLYRTGISEQFNIEDKKDEEKDK